MIRELFNSESDGDADEASRRRSMSLDELRAIVTSILEHRGVTIETTESLERDGALRVVTLGGQLRDARQVVYLEAHPLHGRVDHHVVDDLVEDVLATGAIAGLLFTPYHIDRGTAGDTGVALELVDGLALKRLVEHLDPARASSLDAYRLAGLDVS